MDNKNKQRQYAAYLARRFYTGQIGVKQMIDDFTYKTDDPEIEKLFNLVGNTPKKGGLFGVSKTKYQEYVLKVYELIEKLEKAN